MKVSSILAVLGVSYADIEPHGKSNGDSLKTADNGDLQKIPLQSPAEIFGMANVDRLWISSHGIISLENIDLETTSIDDFDKNFILAPMWTSRSDTLGSSKIFHRVENNGKKVVITFKNVVTASDADTKNTYQVVIESISGDTHVTFNGLDDLNWQPTGGFETLIRAADKESERCGYNFDPTPTDGNAKVFPFHRLECGEFETECPALPEGTSSSSTGYLSFMGVTDPEQWIFSAEYQCIPGFEMDNGDDTLITECLYDADYYDARWSSEPPQCSDGTAVKTFQASVVATHINGENAEEALNQPGRTDEAHMDIHSAIVQVGESIGLQHSNFKDLVLVPADPTTDADTPFRSEEEGGAVIVQFEIKLPLAVKDKVTQDDIEENMINVFSESPEIDGIIFDPNSVSVIETTPACLTDCLGCKGGRCGNTPPPIPFDACCGGCPAENPSAGKPYSTIIKACCVNGWDAEIYDPDTHICCHGDVITKADYNKDPPACK